jgi:hypothetical protein
MSIHEPPAAAEYLDEAALYDRYLIPPRTAQRWRVNGEGPPYVRLGPRRIAYRVADVERWLTVRTYVLHRLSCSRCRTLVDRAHLRPPGRRVVAAYYCGGIARCMAGSATARCASTQRTRGSLWVRAMAITDSELQALAAQFISENGVTKLRTRVASAPAIKPIRDRLKRGVSISISRGSKRQIVFHPAPKVVERIVHDEGEARQRRNLSGVSLGNRNDRQR